MYILFMYYTVPNNIYNLIYLVTDLFDYTFYCMYNDNEHKYEVRNVLKNIIWNHKNMYEVYCDMYKCICIRYCSLCMYLGNNYDFSWFFVLKKSLPAALRGCSVAGSLSRGPSILVFVRVWDGWVGLSVVSICWSCLVC